MAVGAVSSQAAYQLSSGSPFSGGSRDSKLHTTPLPIQKLPSPNLDTHQRAFFWETVSLCELYSVAHIVVLPPSPRNPYSTPRYVIDGTNGINGHKSRPASLVIPSRIAKALQATGLDPVNSDTPGVSVFTLIFPSADGYVARSDFLHVRLQDFPFPALRVHECLAPLERYGARWSSNPLPTAEDGLLNLIQHAAGVVQWADLASSLSVLELQNHLLCLTHELRDRLNNAPWLSPTPIARKRVALVRGRPNITAGGPVYRAAKALGLDLVIVDDPGHWLQAETKENRQHREAFLATDMTEDAGVVDRIVNSLRSYPLPIHGVFTLSDNFFVAVAKVAETLGLPACPVSAFETSVDKYRSRLLQDVAGQTAKVSSVAELQALLTPSDNSTPRFSPSFPMIVKPTKGWSSECVSKANSIEDLEAAVEKATARHGSAAVIEPFFDGPEIDVNFVLLDGEILFCEIADEPPCDADSSAATVHDTFSPSALTLPSALPPAEQETAKSTLRDILVRLGFRTGVFHVEARMVNSSCEYRDVGHGIVDLVPRDAGNRPTGDPVCRLIEINARPPGFRVSVPSRHVYGVDYFAAHMMAAVGDHGRLAIVARPFDHSSPARVPAAQYWSRLVYVPAPAAGIVRWKTRLPPCEELKRRRPDLASRMVVTVDYNQPGDRVELFTDGARTYVAHVLVSSTVSRQDAIEVGNEILRHFEIGIEQESGSD